MSTNKLISIGLGIGLLAVFCSSSWAKGPTVKAEPSGYAPKFVGENSEEKVEIPRTPRVSKTPVVGEVFQEFKADINRDGHKERVILMPFVAKDEGTFMRLMVYNHRDELIWQTPNLTDPTNKRTFGAYDWGICDIQALCDIDKDGYMDLIGTMPRSDVRPAYFRVWKWDGDKFVYQFTSYLVEKGKGSEIFAWSKKDWDGISDIRWVDGLDNTEDGNLKANIVSYEKPNKVNYGVAKLSYAAKERFKVVKWFKHILDIKY